MNWQIDGSADRYGQEKKWMGKRGEEIEKNEIREDK